ncbi:MAG: hypothetical protein KF868_00465 [Acidobacteria bacterium]|nr:hypothetical protein [Acidobacteriota bacterium]MCW5969413.1 hypothetical protein [Blastocatellales bacterium]
MLQSDLDILRDISLRLEAAGIAFMLTGSVAMNQYAQPRMTRDIDISELQLRDVKNLLTPECGMDYVTSRAARLGVADLLNEVMTEDE